MWPPISVLLVISTVTLSLVTRHPHATAIPLGVQEDDDTAETFSDQSEHYIDLDLPPPNREGDSSLLNHEALSESFHYGQESAGYLTSETILSSDQQQTEPGNTSNNNNMASMEDDHSHETLQQYPESSDYQPHESYQTSDLTGEQDNNEPPTLETTTTTTAEAEAEPIPRHVAMEDEENQESSFTVNSSDSQPAAAEQPTIIPEQTFGAATTTTTSTAAAEAELIHDKTNDDDNHETKITSSNAQDQQDGESTPTIVHEEDSQAGSSTEEPSLLNTGPIASRSDSEKETADGWTGERAVTIDLTDHYRDHDEDTVLDSPTMPDRGVSETVSLHADDDDGIPSLDNDFVAPTTSIETPEQQLSTSTSTDRTSQIGNDENGVTTDTFDSTPQANIITTDTGDATPSESSAELVQGSQPVLVEDASKTTTTATPDSTADASEEKVVPASEDSLASFFEKVKNKNRGETNKAQKKSHHPSSTSFEALASQQEQINTIMAAQDEAKSKILQNLNDLSTSAKSYSGLPWGVVHGMNRRLPDLELLYLLFENYINSDGKLDRNRAMARFPLSMGQEQEFDELEVLSDDELDFLLSNQQQEINSAMMEAEKLLKKSTTNIVGEFQDDIVTRNADDTPAGPQTEHLRMERHDKLEGTIAFDDLVEGLDDIDKFFLSVDPPDELDVGAASGSSMQELIMGKGREILVKKVLLGFRFLRHVVATTTKRLVARSLWYKDRASDNFHLLESIRNFDWKETANALRTTTNKLFDVVVEFFDDLMERDDESASMQDGSIHETLDLEAIRKMGGIKL